MAQFLKYVIVIFADDIFQKISYEGTKFKKRRSRFTFTY